MTITETITELRAKAEKLNLDLEGMDDEDIIIRALNHFQGVLELELNEIEEEEEPITFEEYYNDFHELKGEEAI
jgi:hypothetical protein